MLMLKWIDTVGESRCLLIMKTILEHGILCNIAPTWQHQDILRIVCSWQSDAKLSMIKTFGPKVQSNYSDHVLSLSTIYGHAVTWPNQKLFSTKYNAVRSVCWYQGYSWNQYHSSIFVEGLSIVFLILIPWRRDTMARVPLTIIGWLLLRRSIIGVPTFNFSLCGGSEPIFNEWYL